MYCLCIPGTIPVTKGGVVDSSEFIVLYLELCDIVIELKYDNPYALSVKRIEVIAALAGPRVTFGVVSAGRIGEI